MQDLSEMFKRYKKYIFFLLSIYVVGWGFTDYQAVFLGLILGTTFSLYNLFVMVRKNNRFGQAITEGKRAGSLGTFSRMASAGLAVLIVYQYPEHFHLVSTVLGLMTAYVVIMIDFFFQNLRK
ncbi:ATP synthase subunit I [Bacillus timonensis]|nr:ATP synthase subunit I [Bacillus timonensis]